MLRETNIRAHMPAGRQRLKLSRICHVGPDGSWTEALNGQHQHGEMLGAWIGRKFERRRAPDWRSRYPPPACRLAARATRRRRRRLADLMALGILQRDAHLRSAARADVIDVQIVAQRPRTRLAPAARAAQVSRAGQADPRQLAAQVDAACGRARPEPAALPAGRGRQAREACRARARGIRRHMPGRHANASARKASTSRLRGRGSRREPTHDS
jgi:hypothetical protein